MCSPSSCRPSRTRIHEVSEWRPVIGMFTSITCDRGWCGGQVYGPSAGDVGEICWRPNPCMARDVRATLILTGRRGSCRIGGGRGTGYVNNTPAPTVAKLDDALEVMRARRRCQQD
jgi:hypothetical protein